ncbi:MAG TPA: amidohydrolase family protein [Streptosporangiaceae bacterium]|jgi:hypothetical protein
MVDLIFTGGPVVTVDPRRPRAEALAVADGRIRAIGATEEVLRHRRPDTYVVDLAGRALLPGFVEAHGHPTLAAMALAPPAVDVRPFTVPTGADVLETIRTTAADAEPGTPLLFYGADVLLQPGLTPPSRADLDKLAPHNPVVVVADSGHAAYANTALLEAAQITKDTPDPPRGVFVRDTHGDPTGEGRQPAAVAVLMAPASRAAGTRFPVNMRQVYAELAAAGITTVTDMAYGAHLRDRLALLAGDPDIRVRLRAYEVGTAALAADADHRMGEWPGAGTLFARAGVKLWVDGSPWQGDAATSFPYLDTEATRRMGLGDDHRGGLDIPPVRLAELATAFAEQGFQLACHAEGDAAIDAVLDAYEQAQGATGFDDLRPRLEHCGAMTAAQYRRAADLGATVSLFPEQLYYWGDALVDDLFGEEHGAGWAAAKSAFDAGLRVSFHNDGTVTPPSPLGNVAAAVTRTTRGSGRVLAPDERVTVDQALRAQTIDPAWQLHLDNEIGSLEVGKQADLTVLTADPHDTDLGGLRGLGVVATYLGGRQTHGAPL